MTYSFFTLKRCLHDFRGCRPLLMIGRLVDLNAMIGAPMYSLILGDGSIRMEMRI